MLTNSLKTLVKDRLVNVFSILYMKSRKLLSILGGDVYFGGCCLRGCSL